MPRTRAATTVAVLLGAATLAVAAPPPSATADDVVRVRIEGRSSTLFEGPISTRGHAVKATSDPTTRRCDGTNNSAHAAPGPTPTASAADGMRLAGGQGFDAQWYPGFDDYFLKQFGPDRENEDAYEYWGILVNGIYTSVGGCQYRMNAGDLALWVYDAFNGRPILRLDGPAGQGEPTSNEEGGPATTPVQQVFTVNPNQAFPVRTFKKLDATEGSTSNYGPAPGVGVSPVATAANGVQTVLRTDAATRTTDGSGAATLSWSTPGWKRVKAAADGAVPSNRLDVCVQPCGAPPADTQVRTPPASGLAEPPAATATGTGGRRPPGASLLTFGSVRLSAPYLAADGARKGRLHVQWSVLERGSGLRGWRLESKALDRRGSTWVRRATGTTQNEATIRLPTGHTYALRVRFTGNDGATKTSSVGSDANTTAGRAARIVVPIDDRARSLRYAGRKVRGKDSSAWLGTLTVLSRGARFSKRLAAGRPVLQVRDQRRAARVEIRSGRSRQVVRLRARRGRTITEVRGRRLRRAATVRFRVLSGTVSVDGVAVGP